MIGDFLHKTLIDYSSRIHNPRGFNGIRKGEERTALHRLGLGKTPLQ